MKFPRGSLMLEALIAIGIGGMFVAALLGYLVMTNASNDRAREYALALWNTQEGIDALQTLSFASLTNTTVGSLAFASGRWTLGTSAPQALANGMTRTVKVENVSRDANCLVVTTGGTVDTDSKKLTSTTTWTDASERVHSVTLTSLRTNWENPTGACFAATQATQVTFNVSGAVFSGGKQLRQVYFTNNGTSTVTIDKLSFTWNNGAELDQMFMDTSKVWSASGPGTPTHSLLTGETMDIANFNLTGGGTAELNKGQFNINMAGTTLTMTVTFTDGSTWTSPSFNPL